MATHSSVLAWRIPGTAEPGGLLSMGLGRVGHDWSDLAAGAAATGKREGKQNHLGRVSDYSTDLTRIIQPLDGLGALGQWLTLKQGKNGQSYIRYARSFTDWEVWPRLKFQFIFKASTGCCQQAHQFQLSIEFFLPPGAPQWLPHEENQHI